jgi:molybdate transport system substrate-binding protein
VYGLPRTLLVSRRIALLSTVAFLGCGRKEPRDEPLRIAAAADLASALEEIMDRLAALAPPRPTAVYGSSGLLSRQIAEGAPYDLFASANVDFVDRLVREGAADGATRRLYARGRLGIFARSDAHGGPPQTFQDLAHPRFVKIALANPEHAPYGRAAMTALRRTGVLPAVEKRLVYGENVQQTLELARSGNADAALSALSLAGRWTGVAIPVDVALHDPLDQALVVCARSSRKERANVAAAFFVSPAGQEILARHGFLPPPDMAPTP